MGVIRIVRVPTQYNGKNFMVVDNAQAIRMEVAINMSDFSHQWIKVADKLYEFGIGPFDSVVNVTVEQYLFLLKVQ